MAEPLSEPASVRLKRWGKRALVVSIVVHLCFGVVSAFIIAMRMQHKPEAIFQADPPPRARLEPRKLEMKVRVQELQKRSARPQLQPRMLAMSPTDLGLPEIKTRKKADKKVQRNYAAMGVPGVGQGIGGGLGDGMGGGSGFFGLSGNSALTLYVVDFSASMTPAQFSLLKKELAQSIRGLPRGTFFQVICFSGPVWFLGDQVQQSQNTRSTVISGGKKYAWRSPGGPGNYRFAGNINNLPSAPWRPTDFATLMTTARNIDALNWSSARSWGTTWEWPLRVALNMDPKPELIYFMTDGRADRMPQTVKLVTKLNSKGDPAVIHTIGMISEPAAKRQLAALAKQNGGQFRAVGN
jgi:hypothetical protein